MTQRSKLFAKVAVRLDSGQKFIILKIEIGQQITLSTCRIPTTLIQNGFPCTQNSRIYGKSTGKGTALKRNTHSLSQKPLVS